jgi:hypothetical protein
MKLTITPIELDEVLYYDSYKFNTNNHWDKIPDDYYEKLQLTYAPYWIEHFKRPYKSFSIDLRKPENKWLIEANRMGNMTGTFIGYYDDELSTFLENNKEISALFTSKYFVRTTKYSLKHGIYGCGPYTNLEMVIKSLVSGKVGHSSIDDDTTILTFYMIDWVDIIQDLEFRVFVFENNITAISQQNIYKYNEILNDAIISDITTKILEYFKNSIKPKIIHIDSYTIDLAIVDNAVYFIELNSFGKESASGSALFHWIYDEHILMNKSNAVEFRYTVKINDL